MKLYLILLGASLVFFTACGPIDVVGGPPDAEVPRPEAHPCDDKAKAKRCERDRPGNYALCYDEGEAWEEPLHGNGQPWPYSGCAAPDEQGNFSPELAHWAWWCCAPVDTD